MIHADDRLDPPSQDIPEDVKFFCSSIWTADFLQLIRSVIGVPIRGRIRYPTLFG